MCHNPVIYSEIHVLHKWKQVWVSFMRLGSFYGIYDESGFIEIYMAEKASQSGANSVESYENQ